MGRVMVVDDEPDMRMALRMFLERYGNTVDEASDGEQALGVLKETAFDLVLLDMRMPGLDGLQTLTKIREMNKELPVIMVTGYGSVESAEEIRSKGANHYISKPFKHEELLGAMAKVGLSVETTVGPTDPAGLLSTWRQRGIALGLLLVVSVGWAINQEWFSNKDYKLPYSNPVDMAWKDGKLYIADWITQSIYVHDTTRGDLATIKTFYLPDAHFSGLAVCGDQLFISDSWTKQIRRFKMDDTLTPETSFKSPGPSPTSLFCDGKYLWSVDSSLGMIYQQRLDERMTMVAQFKSPGHSPVGFFKDDQYAWSSDSQTRRLYRLRLDDHLTPMAAYSLEDLEQRQEPLSCFQWVGSNLWFARDRLNKVFRRNRKRLKSVSLG